MAPKKGLILWQQPMVRVVTALVPASLASIYFFGWRALVILAIVNAAAFLTEYLFLRPNRQPVTSAVFVTGFILALSLPPTIPYWMAALGAVVAVLFGKMVFGGFGRNPFNPAMVGRAFLYVSFGLQMTGSWVEPFSGLPAGFARYASDAVTKASPLAQMAGGTLVPWQNLLLGNVAGSLGETSAILFLLGGLYIVWRRAASYQIVLGALAATVMMQAVFWLAGIQAAIDPLHALLAGGYMFALFFIVTEPVSASQTTNVGRWIYGAVWGALVVVIRLFSIWPEGVMFAILVVNMFAPILDYVIKQARQKRKAA